MDIASAVCSRYSTSRERELEKKSHLWVSIIRALCRASPITIRNSTRNLTDQIITFISFVLSTLWRGQVLTITNILTFQFEDFGSYYSKRDDPNKGSHCNLSVLTLPLPAKLRQCDANSEFPFWRNFASLNLRISLSLLLRSTLCHK